MASAATAASSNTESLLDMDGGNADGTTTTTTTTPTTKNHDDGGSNWRAFLGNDGCESGYSTTDEDTQPPPSGSRDAKGQDGTTTTTITGEKLTMDDHSPQRSTTLGTSYSPEAVTQPILPEEEGMNGIGMEREEEMNTQEWPPSPGNSAGSDILYPPPLGGDGDDDDDAARAFLREEAINGADAVSVSSVDPDLDGPSVDDDDDGHRVAGKAAATTTTTSADAVIDQMLDVEAEARLDAGGGDAGAAAETTRAMGEEGPGSSSSSGGGGAAASSSSSSPPPPPNNQEMVCWKCPHCLIPNYNMGPDTDEDPYICMSCNTDRNQTRYRCEDCGSINPILGDNDPCPICLDKVNQKRAKDKAK